MFSHTPVAPREEQEAMDAETVTVAVCVIGEPVVGVTVSVYVVVAVGLTLTAVPLVTEILPGVITPMPLANAPVRFELDPEVIVDGLAVKLVMVGNDVLAFTVTVLLDGEEVPPAPVQVKVYVVVLVGETLCVPLVGSGPFQPPLAVHEVAFVLDQESVELLPAVIVAGFAAKLVMVGGTEPMQPARLATTRLKVRAKAPRNRITLMASPAHGPLRSPVRHFTPEAGMI